ncbi:hypothetical protein JN11_04474 [Mucilaginibacter frigoritolerans]|uniref:Uncharacterized protein n=1 Tax=Mucilaginibacter frigoritolerans TaxID=652788 RepID=A0A562TNC0_9SPHI|nr:hypothetical protein [Mucilaginibacter frigoritolerans]TWI95045.1 hypothetical protein JN11_04474 [Mucilaginibacter frigoritolerans]
MNWTYLVIVICGILAVFTVIMEYRRVNRQRLGLRITALLIAIASIGALTLPVSYWGETKLGTNEAVLITTGYNRDSLNEFKTDTLFTTDSVINAQNPKTRLITIDQLQNVVPAISRLHILGFGLTQDELKQLDSIPIVFHQAAYPFGITSISWTEKIKQGQHCVIQGTFNNSTHNQVKLVLSGLNTNIDSLLVGPTVSTSFELTDLPKIEGKTVDRLLVISGKDTLENEKIPIVVSPVRPLKVLVLSGSPNFENKFLKNWLADNGFAVAVRSAISKNKFSTEYINIEQLPINQLTPQVLDNFDVLISDLSVLKALNNDANTLIKNQVVKNSMGLIVSVDTVFKTTSWFQNGIAIYKRTSADQQGSPLNFLGEKNASKILSNEQLFIGNSDNMQTLVTDGKHRELACTGIMGAGKIVLTTIGDSYSWMLAGNKNDYSAFWSLLVRKAAKPNPQLENWKTVNNLPVLNAPATLSIETASPPAAILIDDVSTAPLQNMELPFQWQNTWWPVKTGWQPVKRTHGAIDWIYVYETTDWATIKAIKQTTDTKKYESAITLHGVTKQIHQKAKIAAPKIYFYTLLLFCCTFLWFEAKFQAKQTTKG